MDLMSLVSSLVGGRRKNIRNLFKGWSTKAGKIVDPIVVVGRFPARLSSTNAVVSILSIGFAGVPI